MTASVFIGASRQCCAYARALLAGVEEIEPNQELRRAMKRGVLYHLESALLMHLRSLAESYVPGAGASVQTPRELLASLQGAGIRSPEAGEINDLAGDPGSWLHTCVEACNSLYPRGFPPTGSSPGGGDIALYQDHGSKHAEPSSEQLKNWLNALTELIDRHCALMAEY